MSEAVATPAAPASPAAPATPPPAAPAEGASTPAQNTADTATATPTPDETKGKTPDPAEKRGTSRFERRISRLHREAAEARAERDLLRRQLEEIKPKEAPDPGAPKLENFKDIEEYAAAKAKYESQKVLKEHQAKQQNETRQRAYAKLVEEWESKAARGSDKYEDFEEIVGDIKPTTPWSHAAMEADNAEEVLYYLGKNLKEVERIAALSPTAQIREIGKIEAKLAATPPKPATPSKAPAPITPLTGAAPVTERSIYEPNLPYEEFKKLRNKQLGRTR